MDLATVKSIEDGGQSVHRGVLEDDTQRAIDKEIVRDVDRIEANLSVDIDNRCLRVQHQRLEN